MKESSLTFPKFPPVARKRILRELMKLDSLGRLKRPPEQQQEQDMNDSERIYPALSQKDKLVVLREFKRLQSLEEQRQQARQQAEQRPPDKPDEAGEKKANV